MKISTKEGFEALPLEANLESAGDLDKIVQGDMKSVGGMSNLDNMDGTGTGPVVKAEPEVKADAKPYPKNGKPDGSIFKGQAFGSGGPIPNLPDMTLGVVPISEQGGEHGYPKQTHGVRIFKAQPLGEYGAIKDPNTYSYIDDIVSNGHVKR